ncbi:hypothetical protein DSM112329_02487 [Paraconexibacter sp. AEG42_29]|uniref:WD40 repeat domain-containing protein n=1 Tax=Paraconexibacter sp. AEG42_29 TaxID=2997339 RepID=A0AAU7AVB9_9ACTN
MSRSRRRLRRAPLLLPAVVALTLVPAAITAGPAAAADPPRYKLYYDIFDRGDTKIPGHDTRWVPQGLAYWPARDALVISYYDGEGKKNSRLALIDRRSGKRLQLFELPRRGHVGALAMSDNYLCVGDGGSISRFHTAVLSRTGELPFLQAAGSYKVKASSFMTIVGKQMWVGNYDKHKDSTAYRYTFVKGGVPRYDKVTMNVPRRAQGMAITGSQVIWSVSTGEDADSRLMVRPLTVPTAPRGRDIVAPNMSEGIVIAGNELHVLYESGAAKYKGADYKVRTVHHGLVASVLG